MIGVLKESEMETLLEKQLVGRIGCADAGKVYIVPVTFVYRDGYIYGHTRPGKKIDMMRANPNVCFETELIRDMHHWECVIAWGVYEELKGTDAKLGIQIMMNRTHGLQSTHWFDIGFHESVTYRVLLNEKSGKFENKG